MMNIVMINDEKNITIYKIVHYVIIFCIIQKLVKRIFHKKYLVEMLI